MANIASWPEPLIVTAFTPSNGYDREVDRLIASLERFRLPHLVESYESRGGWEANCAYKAEVVDRALATTMRPIVWLDADAEVVAEPTLFRKGGLRVDVAAAWFRNRLLSGTVFFGCGETAQTLCKQWRQRCQQNPRVWDQRHLQAVVRDWEVAHGSAGIQRLPLSYTKILDLMPSTDAVILHHQASRRLNPARKSRIGSAPRPGDAASALGHTQRRQGALR